jgi:hypothetical protein
VAAPPVLHKVYAVLVIVVKDEEVDVLGEVVMLAELKLGLVLIIDPGVK